MEKKNVAKISLSTFFLILAIIAIVIMGIIIYKMNNDKLTEIQKSNELQLKVNSLNENIKELQSKINSNSTKANIKEIANTDTVKSSFTKGTYKHESTTVTFEDTKFCIKLDNNFSLNGVYEINDNNTVICNISEYSFNNPEGTKRFDIDKNEKWSISFDIKDEKSLNVKNINVPDRESEIIIGIFNLIQNGNTFVLQ